MPAQESSLVDLKKVAETRAYAPYFRRLYKP